MSAATVVAIIRWYCSIHFGYGPRWVVVVVVVSVLRVAIVAVESVVSVRRVAIVESDDESECLSFWTMMLDIVNHVSTKS